MADAGLRRDAVGLREVLFQSITDMAPGAAIAASIPAGVAFAGGALPLAVVFALIACLFSAWSIGQLATGPLSDRTGRKPVMLFGLGLAAVSFVPGFQLLAQSANPAMTAAAAHSPVVVVADPADCSVQFDPVGKNTFATSCDIAKSALANAGIPYTNRPAAPGAQARVQIGNRLVASPNGPPLNALQLAAAKKTFAQTLRRGLAEAGYPPSAAPSALDVPRTLALLLVFIIAASALYGPQAAALVELFPTRIRYSALSFPYHVGVGWFGGFLPVIAFAIVVATGNIYAGLWYPTVVAAIGFVVTFFFLPETRARDIEA